MAFDYGSIDLGLRNPFKKVGAVTAVTGSLRALMGLGLLVLAASTVQEQPVAGWIYGLVGLFLLTGGIRTLGSGTFAMLRYFVGRNHPTSLAYNFSKSESSTAKQESRYVGYKNQTLEEMLVGRKNVTFTEPQGFLARLLHTLIPKLLFMPYPIRNLCQRVFGAGIKTAVAILAYALVAFVTLAGFVGDIGSVIFPVYSVLLAVYVVGVWWQTGRAVARRPENQIQALGSGDLAKVIAVALVVPVLVGLGLGAGVSSGAMTSAMLQQWVSVLDVFHPTGYLLAILALACASAAILYLLLRRRLAIANPIAEVSELRENWQESVHPNEIFINLDNLVMANRRYKEVPNRVYKELDPQLQEQVEGKGDFKGEMIQEVQPRVKPMELGQTFQRLRLIALVVGNLFAVGASLTVVWLAFAGVDLYQATNGLASPASQWLSSSAFATVVNVFIVGAVLRAFASLLSGAAHLFFAEIQFESMLVYFKCEGTFTESKMSTGTGIHDSTRSENTLVRSSITPWIIVTRVVSSTFAATGMRNLEFARYIMEMQKAPQELDSIRQDVVAFLKDRESIASITSERDLGNASQIYQLNQQTRAALPEQSSRQDEEEAAGYLRQENSQTDDSRSRSSEADGESGQAD